MADGGEIGIYLLITVLPVNDCDVCDYQGGNPILWSKNIAKFRDFF